MKIGEGKQARWRTVLALLSGEDFVERSPCMDLVKTLPSPFCLLYGSSSKRAEIFESDGGSL